MFVINRVRLLLTYQVASKSQPGVTTCYWQEVSSSLDYGLTEFIKDCDCLLLIHTHYTCDTLSDMINYFV